MDRGLRFFSFLFSFLALINKRGAEVAFCGTSVPTYLGSEKWKRGRVNKAITDSLQVLSYVCMYICTCTYPQSFWKRSCTFGKVVKTPVDDDSDIGKCDNVFSFPYVGARWRGQVAWKVGTSGTLGSHLAGHLPAEKTASSSGTRFTSCEQPTHASNQ